MRPDHTHYEILATLAAAGQLSTAEIAEFNGHTANCSACTKTLIELSALNREIFLLAASQTHPEPLPHGMAERFTQRAMRAGIPITPPARNSFRLLQLASVAVLLMLSLTFLRKPVHEPAILTAEMTQVAPVIPQETVLNPAPRLHRRPVRIRIAQRSHRPVFTLETPAFPQHDYANLGLHTLPSQTSEAAGRYVTAGLSLPGAVSLSRPPLPSFRAITRLLATDQHPNPKVASLSFTDEPVVFHFNPK